MSDNPILAALAELSATMTGRLDAMGNRFDATDSRLDAVVARLEHVESGQDRFRVDLMGRIDRLQNQFTSLRDDVAVNFGRADKAEEAADGTRRELRALSDIVSAMERQIQHLQTDVRQLKGEP